MSTFKFGTKVRVLPEYTSNQPHRSELGVIIGTAFNTDTQELDYHVAFSSERNEYFYAHELRKVQS